jgi:hypothetical protein
MGVFVGPGRGCLVPNKGVGDVGTVAGNVVLWQARITRIVTV